MKSIIHFWLFLALALLPAHGQGLLSLAGSPPSAGGSAAPTPELLWWPLNAGSGTTIVGDASGGGDDGSHVADHITGASGSGSALDFNGTSDWASCSTAIAPGSAVVTVCLWVYADAIVADSDLVESSNTSDGSAHTFRVYIEGSLIKVLGRGTTGYRQETVAVTTGSWIHIAAIIDNSTATGEVQIYKDGVSQTTTLGLNNKTGTSNFSSQRIFVGARSSSSKWFDGRIDDVRIYNRELTSTEISNIYADPQ